MWSLCTRLLTKALWALGPFSALWHCCGCEWQIQSRCWAPPPSEKWAQCWGFLKGFCSNSGGGEVEITWSEVSCVGQCRFSRGGVGSGEDLSLLLSSRGPDPIRSPVLFLPLCISEPIKFRFAEVHFVIHSFQARDWLFIFLDTIKAQYLKQISTQLFSLDSLNGALKSKINSAVAERYISAFLSGFAKFF